MEVDNNGMISLNGANYQVWNKQDEGFTICETILEVGFVH
jgi:hypothetical protein